MDIYMGNIFTGLIPVEQAISSHPSHDPSSRLSSVLQVRIHSQPRTEQVTRDSTLSTSHSLGHSDCFRDGRVSSSAPMQHSTCTRNPGDRTQGEPLPFGYPDPGVAIISKQAEARNGGWRCGSSLEQGTPDKVYQDYSV